MNSTETKGITDRYSPLARLVTAAGPDFGAAAVFEDAIAAVFDAAQDIMLSKRAQRGTDNITEQGLSGVLARLASDSAQPSLARPAVVAAGVFDLAAVRRLAGAACGGRAGGRDGLADLADLAAAGSALAVRAADGERGYIRRHAAAAAERDTPPDRRGAVAIRSQICAAITAVRRLASRSTRTGAARE